MDDLSYEAELNSRLAEEAELRGDASRKRLGELSRYEENAVKAVCKSVATHLYAEQSAMKYGQQLSSFSWLQHKLDLPFTLVATTEHSGNLKDVTNRLTSSKLYRTWLRLQQQHAGEGNDGPLCAVFAWTAWERFLVLREFGGAFMDVSECRHTRLLVPTGNGYTACVEPLCGFIGTQLR